MHRPSRWRVPPWTRLLGLALAGLAVAGCTERGPDATAVATNDARIAHAVYDDSLEAARRMRTAIENFVADPTESSFAAAREAWLKAREPYGQSEVYRFRLSPIDSTGTSALCNNVSSRSAKRESCGYITCWPPLILP